MKPRTDKQICMKLQNFSTAKGTNEWADSLESRARIYVPAIDTFDEGLMTRGLISILRTKNTKYQKPSKPIK